MVRQLAVRLIYLACRLHRVWPPLGSFVKALNHVITGVDFAAGAVVGPGLTLYHPTGVVVGPNVQIGRDVVIQQNVTLGHGRGGSPSIGDGAFLGPGSVVVGRYSVGAGSILGANAVVTCDIPPREIWAGVPARHLRAV